MKFQYAAGEYARALRRHRIRHFHLYRDLSIWAATVIAASFLQLEGRVFWLAVCALGFYPLVAGLAAGIYPFIAPRLRAHLKAPYKLIFSDDEIAFSATDVQSNLPWSFYQGWSKDADFIYLSLGRGHATIIPRRAFDHVDREAALISLLNRKLGPERDAA